MTIANLILTGYILGTILTYIFIPRSIIGDLDNNDLVFYSVFWGLFIPILIVLIILTIIPMLKTIKNDIISSRNKVQDYFDSSPKQKQLISKKDIKRQESYRAMYCQSCGNSTDR